MEKIRDIATCYGKSLDLAGIHVAASDHLLRLRQLRGIMALVVLLVRIESVDSALLFLPPSAQSRGGSPPGQRLISDPLSLLFP